LISTLRVLTAFAGRRTRRMNRVSLRGEQRASAPNTTPSTKRVKFKLRKG
jgi:hypothetical protein